MSFHNPIIGLVLCGGKSSRMGQDKGTLRHQDKYWANHVQQCFDQLGIPSYLSINHTQKENYEACGLDRLILDQVAIDGPMRGLLSAHQVFPRADIFVLACDMINMDIPTVSQLLDIRTQIIHADVYTFLHKQRPEPCCAIYTTSGLQKLTNEIQAGGLKHYSLQKFIKRLHPVYIPAPTLDYAFRNYNSPKDLTNRSLTLQTIPGNFL